MRRPLIAGNWKMNGTKESVATLLSGLKQNCERVEVAELAVLAPFVFLGEVERELVRSQIAWGVQDLSHEKNGAFTGDISATMLTDFGCSYVTVGHSERRQYHHESNQLVAKKFHAALAAHVRPILCVGETEIEHEQGKTLQVVQEQLAAVLDLADNHGSLSTAVVAYEPVWAIGTGKQATPEQAQDVHAALRAQLGEFHPDLAEQVRILYGGSMKPSNAAGLLAMPDVDGGLIGGAALDAEQFIEIGMLCNN